MARRFGVEIEAGGARMQTVADAMNAAGIRCYVAGYTHTVGDSWKLVTDGSLEISRGFELVSPILVGDEGLETLRRVFAILNDIGCIINRSCGLHVHVDAADCDVADVKAVAKAFIKHEHHFDSLVPPSRRCNRYCTSNLKTLAGRDAQGPAARESAIARIDACETVNSLRMMFETNYLGARYHKLNLEALGRYRTIEFRQHSATLSAAKAIAWVSLCIGFVTRARKLRDKFTLGANSWTHFLRYATEQFRAALTGRREDIAELEAVS